MTDFDVSALAMHDDAGSPLGAAVAAAVLAAVIGATAWALMVVETNHSFGIAAIGLGLLAAALVERFTGGRRGVVLVAAAMAAVLVGLVVGKYAAFAYILHRDAENAFGPAGAGYYGYLSGNTWNAFWGHLGDEFSPFYLLWVGLAGSVVWRRLGAAKPTPPAPAA
jgi:hypothetical protein